MLIGTVAPASNIIYGLPIPGFEAHRIGNDRYGAVCLIIAADEVADDAQPDIELGALTVRRQLMCEITRPGGARESISGTMITCAADSAELRFLFLDIFDQAFEAIRAEPGENNLDKWIDHARRLFAELDSSAPREIRGLWAELLVICESADPASMIRRWHDDPHDRCEFFHDGHALLVKTCGSDSERIHRFALTQLRPEFEERRIQPRIATVIVASVPVQSAPEGHSVFDLFGEINGRLNDNILRTRLQGIVFRLGGPALSTDHARFDRDAARKGCRWLQAQSIPAIEKPPKGVIAAHLEIDCEDVPDQDLATTVLDRLRG
jgi:hypothetical protein